MNIPAGDTGMPAVPGDWVWDSSGAYGFWRHPDEREIALQNLTDAGMLPAGVSPLPSKQEEG